MISALLATIVPTFGIVGIGWIARRVGIWEKSSVKVLNNYAYYIALPALMFQGIVRGELRNYFSATDVKFIVGVIVAHVIVFLFALALYAVHRVARDVRATAPMLTVLGNTAYLGIPFATYAFGERGTAYASLLSVALLTIFIFASIAVLNRFGKPAHDESALIKILELPFLWAVLLGLLWPIFQLPALPLFIGRFIEILAQGAGPTALLGLGTFLYDLELRDIPWAKASFLGGIKVIAPTLLAFFILQALNVSGILLAVGVSISAVSTAVTTFVLASEYRIGERLTAGTILVSTFFSLIALSTISALWIGTTIFQ